MISASANNAVYGSLTVTRMTLHARRARDADLFHTYASRTANGAYSRTIDNKGKGTTTTAPKTTYSVNSHRLRWQPQGQDSRITVTINVTDVNGNPYEHRPNVHRWHKHDSFYCGEHCSQGQHIGMAITATDAEILVIRSPISSPRSVARMPQPLSIDSDNRTTQNQGSTRLRN